MAFFDKLGEKISTTAKGVGQKAKDLTEAAKLSASISSENGKISTAYTQIGKKYYELFKDSPDEGLADFCAHITEANLKIIEYRAQLRELRGIEICPNCGAEVENQASFCPKCGSKIAHETAAGDSAAE